MTNWSAGNIFSGSRAESCSSRSSLAVGACGHPGADEPHSWLALRLRPGFLGWVGWKARHARRYRHAVCSATACTLEKLTAPGGPGAVAPGRYSGKLASAASAS
ncbi:hypothetical protein QAD02_016998 [Eretmocerus hayati]|uniref:Uncharacterized protein n=1 Tax=Eretmocerus hayati TaxID=131215 RepID=A0ACC2PDX0_9HYME|nr:hypothetical protein QAD02_016998 [Eretmocerus hayati]